MPWFTPLTRAILLLYLLCLVPFKSSAQLPEGFTQTLIAEELDPTSMVMADDGRIFLSEKSGAIRIIKNDQLLSDPLITLPTSNYGERGLQSIVLDPDFGINQYFYVYYAREGTNQNRLSRFIAAGDYSDVASEVVLMEFDPISSEVHNGGGMVFGPDGKLYLATGDDYKFNVSQQFNSLLGKVIRLNPDGSIPEDNPFYHMLQGNFRSIFALGLRNPYTAAFDRNTGMILINDVGNAMYEEINVLESGKNYGWPGIEGFKTNQTPPANYKDPLYTYDHNVGCAIVGASFYSPKQYLFPEEYHGKFFFGDYCSGKIEFIDPSTGEFKGTFASDIYRPTGILTSRDGHLYYFSRGGIAPPSQEGNSASSSGTLWKVDYVGNGPPQISMQPRDQLICAGEPATFSVNASGTHPLSYQWYKDSSVLVDQTESTLIFPNVSLADSGATFYCKVTNDFGEVYSNSSVLKVTKNTRPVPAMTIPANFFYKAGDTLLIIGEAFDEEDGPIAESSYSWKVDFHHNTHTHPFITYIDDTDSLELIFPTSGETAADVWYRVYFTVNDSQGLSKTIMQDIMPKKTTITLMTEPAGLTLLLDGQPVTTPISFDAVSNLSRTLFAPPVLSDTTNLYVFDSWSDAIKQSLLSFHTPDEDSTFLASYSTIPMGNGEGLKAEFFNQDSSFNYPPDFITLGTVIDFDWSIESPVPGIINKNGFSVRWSGYLKVPADADYTFYLNSDDGSRLYINNNVIVDNWHGVAGFEKSGTINLSADTFYIIKVEYFDINALADIKLMWSSELIPKSIIPKNQFHLINPDNKEPRIKLTLPYEMYKFAVNREVTVVGSSIEGSDPIDPKNLIWRVDLVHDTHTHNIINGVMGIDSLKFLPEIHHGEENVWYRVYATVSDSDGLLSTQFIDVHPNIITISINSNLPEMPFRLNGEEKIAPVSIKGIEGNALKIEVDSLIIIDDITYKFENWTNEDTVRSLSVILPNNDTTVIAHFRSITIITSNDGQIQNELKIYPNPVENLINIEWPGKSKPLYFELLNSTGQLLDTINVRTSSSKTILNLAPYGPGVYFIKVHCRDRNLSYQIIKHH